MIALINRHQWKVAYIMSLLFFISLFEPLLAMDKHKGQPRWYGHEVSGIADRQKLPFEMESAPEENNEYKKKLPLPVDDIDIDGPGQPEMKSFQSVNANNMVDLFTGDFSYNIPLLDVEGYGVALHYNSGITMDQEASWVGLGWNINPGTISRSLRGLPDDFDGINDSLKKTQHIRENKTTGVTVTPSLEIGGFPALSSANIGVFYNNYNGYGIETGVGIGGTGRTSFGPLTAGLSISNNSQQGINISPSLSVTIGKQSKTDEDYGTLGISTGYSSRSGITTLQLKGGKTSELKDDLAKNPLLSRNANFPFASISFARPAYTPGINMPLKNTSYTFTGKVGHTKWAVVPSVAVTGYTNSQVIAPEDTTQTIPAAGYIYSTNGNNREDVVLDFNREKDGEFNYKSTPHIALPQYTYDVYSISGEGTGGTFRPYRGDIGYVFDHNIASRSSSLNGSLDLALGNLWHLGFEITHVTTNNTNHRWNKHSGIEPKLQFQSADTTYEPVYFRNPGEKAINAQSYYRSIGDDSLMRIKLFGLGEHVFALSSFVKYNDESKPHADLPVTETLVKKQRDKRTQVISYLNAEDASILGLDKQIRSYDENTVPLGKCTDAIRFIPRVDGRVRKKNHLSEISVLNSDGRKYIYGLPANNILQRDVTFAVDDSSGTPDSITGLTPYASGDNSTGNRRGKDHYFSKTETPSYTHNFLLTGIISPDYVDITGNGISEDDPGDAIRFNYSQVYGEVSPNGYYKWRTPFQKDTANYNEGLRTYNQDNKATYLYGEKEVWYLNSIESKTMIAVFHLANDRQDGYAVLGENGGINTAKRTRRLDRIDLYVKADLVKKGLDSARPVKSVHFEHSYELCKGAYGKSNTGKLTLKKVWFTYNKNNKGQLNPYTFSYHPDTDGNPVASYNPSYNPSHSDRWGTYKHKGSNPDGMTNTDYPYSTQNKDSANRNASVWSLTDIRLPSGGKIQVTYESDDYAYVQNRRATQMMTIAGINTALGNRLYSPEKTDYYTLYINTPDVLKNKADLRNKYLAIDDVLYFKLAVTMPTDQFGGGIEMVPGYATIEDYGITPGNNQQFWIRLAPVENRSPMTRAALQYLRLNLKSKAYPNSEGIESLGLKELIQMLGTSLSEVKNMVQGFDGAAKSKDFCSQVNLARSFIRLSNPEYKKYGGGYRVKRVEVFDNWKKMTSQRESVYGQDYIYTTTEDVDGEKKTISSGVATYEPMIGGEENPFRRPINYSEKVAPMAPVNFMFSEEPLGESYFPSPMIGYSKVRVRTIHTKAKSANGWTESEYYTSRDFPTKVEHTLLENGVSKFKYETQSNLLRLNHKNYVTLSQGFRVELNDMNGKMKAQSTYAETDSAHPIAYSLNFYKVDDDRSTLKQLNNEVWVVDSANGNVNTKGQIGKDIEVMVDLREQRSLAYTVGFSPNLDVIAPFIPPFLPVLYLPSKVNLPQKEDVRFRSAAVVKIVQRYGILDSVVVMDKGSVVSTKNLVYDGETGNVVLSRTNNDFNDPIYNFNYPAYWAYSGMEPAYKNIGAVFQKSDAGYALNKGRLFQKGSVELFPMERFFESGDEVYVYDADLAPIDANDCRIFTNPVGKWKGKLWVMDAGKGKQGHVGLYFIDSLGRTAPSMIINKMVIIRSGKRNMQDVSAGSVVMLNSPLKELSGGRVKIVIDSTTRVLNASAATFKDMWKVENSEYQVDSCYVLLDTVSNRMIPAVNGAQVFRKSFLKLKNSFSNYELGDINTSNYAASAYKRNRRGNRYIQFNAKSILEFPNLNDIIPSSATVINATLELRAGAPRFIWQGLGEGDLSDFPSRTKAHFNNGDNTDNGVTYSNESVISSAFGWSSGLPYDAIQGGATKVPVSAKTDFSCADDTTINVTSLVAGMVNFPASNHGLLMDIKDWGHYHEHNSSDRTQSYCSRAGSLQHYEGESELPGECLFCETALLKVTYWYYKDTCVKVCRKNISDSATNPYRWGILGNWRMERSYVYYYDREENDATEKLTNIRREGTLKNFIPYWSFASNGIVPITDSSRWIWNSATSSFNRKGLEIENYDALGRYNAGLYGYNQTLPVAVAQNSRYREILYDGFEDYGYKTAECIDCPPKREFDFVAGNTGVATTQLQSHTGLYSLKVDNGSEALLTVPVTSDTSTTDQKLCAALDSTTKVISGVIGAGTGLSGVYTMGTRFRLGFDNTLCFPSGGAQSTRTDTAINFNWSSGAPMSPGPGECSDAYTVTWTGTIQPRYTDIYSFYLRFNGMASISINGRPILTVTTPQSGERTSDDIRLFEGRLYSISITYTKSMDVSHGRVELKWSGRANLSKGIIPSRFLYPIYPELADTAGSVGQSIQYYCVQGDTVKPINVLRDKFSPLTNTKLTVSAWVRLDVEDCNSTPALDSAIQVSFNTGGATTWLKKTGLRIEGWQRYEANINVPADTATMYLRLKTLASYGIYVDDIRVQPFNSSMKSFVYNPVNLRLMAQLDENNYASLYEYDDDGTLIRVKKETERGVMTVQETRSALLKE